MSTFAFARQRLLHCGLLTLLAIAVVALYRLLLHANQTTVALTFLVLVLIVASRWHLVDSIYLSVLCTLFYNYFFLPPFGTFTITDPQNWVALASFLGAGIVVSHLADSEHRQAALSERRRAEVERLYEFSQQLLLQDDISELARAASQLIADVFRLRAVALYVCGQKSVYHSDPADPVASFEELEWAAQMMEGARAPQAGIRVMPLMLGLRSLGAIAMREGEYSDGMYGAIAGLMAIAMERATAVERFSRVEAARERDRLRTALLDSVAHELRTPLTAIRAAVTSLASQESLAESERREMIDIVDEESLRLDRLIGRVMEMAQLDSQGIKLSLLPQRLSEIIDQALEDSHAMLRDRMIVVDIPEDLPSLMLDRELIRRVLRHLLENAAKYSPEGSVVRLQVRITEDRLLVSVIDQGEGVEEADRPLIFDKFYRGRSQRKRVQGTGMGLAIARAIVVAHGGALELSSRPGTATTFTFWIPVETPPESLAT
jgi:two-component system, OmpR family, sensor histidine kinase KdpD